jgi:hypothetical protein
MELIIWVLEEEFGAVETTDLGAAVRVTNLSIGLIAGDNHPCSAPLSTTPRSAAASACPRSSCSWS